jgi:protein-disulfide isomerase-like protein with CxxC motif
MPPAQRTPNAKSKAQVVNEAIETLIRQGRDVTTAAVLALAQAQGITNARPIDVYQSDAWKKLRDKEKAAVQPAAAEPRAAAVSPAKARELSKTEAIKRAFAALGRDAKPAAVIEHVKKSYGLDVSAQTVSNLKARLAKKTGATGKRRGRPPKARSGASRAAAPRRAMAGVSLEDIRAVKALVDRIGADTVRLVAEVLA